MWNEEVRQEVRREEEVKGGKSKVAKVMGEFKRGTLHGGVDPKGPKKAPVVKSRKQAIAIALSEAGMSRRKK